MSRLLSPHGYGFVIVNSPGRVWGRHYGTLQAHLELLGRSQILYRIRHVLSVQSGVALAPPNSETFAVRLCVL